MSFATHWIDGFDDFTSFGPWYSTATASLITGRSGSGQAARYTGNNAFIRRTFKSPMPGPGFHALFYFRLNLTNGARSLVFQADNASLVLRADGEATGYKLSFRNSIDGSGYGSAGTTLIPYSTWTHIEVEYTGAASTGRIKLYLNGNPTPELDFTGSTGTGAMTGFLLGGVPNNFAGQGHDYDDLVIGYNANALHGRVGEHIVETLFPNGNGNSSQLVGSDGNSTDNYLLVDDAHPDASDYVGSSSVGNKDTYAFQNLATPSGSILGVQVQVSALKSDAGTRAVQPVVRHSGSDYNGSDIYLSTTLSYFDRQYDTNPGTSAPWTVSDVNGAEFGARVSV
jgi:hypothetical protein